MMFELTVSSQTMGRASQARALIGPGDEQRVGLVGPQRQGLGHQLAQHQRQERDQRHHDAEGDVLGVVADVGHAGDERLQVAGHGRTAEGGGSGPEDGDPHLHGGQEVFGLGRAGRPATAAPARPLSTSCGTRVLRKRDDGDLGAGEDPVGQDEGEDDEELGKDGALQLCGGSCRRVPPVASAGGARQQAASQGGPRGALEVCCCCSGRFPRVARTRQRQRC